MNEHDEQVMRQETHRQKRMKLRLNLDPTDDVDDNLLFKTKHAASVSKVLGNTAKVIEFDQVRYHLKSMKKPSRALRQSHNKLLAELQSLIQSQKEVRNVN